ncbi:MAG: hypothetical protein SOU03_08590 [Dorea sp.]|nr:hypothetical protein [Dorea sp.]
MKKFTKLFAITMALTMMISANAFACSPLYKPLSEYGYTGVPDVEVELSDEAKVSIGNAVQDYISKMVLDMPEVKSAEYWHKNYFVRKSNLIVTWAPVEDATSYKVEITKPDGAKKEYETINTYLILSEGADEFITGCFKQDNESGVQHATVRVRAYGENETFSPWSNKVNVACSEERSK